MTPHQQLQKLLGDVHRYGAADVVGLLPLAAALQSALHTRMLAIQQQPGMPDTDHLLSTEEVATRLGKSTKWVRDNVDDLAFAIRVGKEHRFSVRGLEEWIAEQRANKCPRHCPRQGGSSMRGNGRVFQRGHVWWLAYYDNGREHRESSGSRERKDAVRMLRQRLGEVAAGAYHAPQRQGPSS